MNKTDQLSLENKIVACSECWADYGLQAIAATLGHEATSNCPSCNSPSGRKLRRSDLYEMCDTFFVDGSVPVGQGMFAPVIQVNDGRGSSDKFGTKELNEDIKRLEKEHGIFCFYYGPPMWMLGKSPDENGDVAWSEEDFDITLDHCQDRILKPNETIYRVRTNLLKQDIKAEQFCSPPEEKRDELWRFDSKELKICYAALDVETCLHETRITLQDNIFVATIRPIKPLRLLDLTTCQRADVTPFDNPMIWINSLLYDGKENYHVCRQLAQRIKNRGYDGFVYRSYFQQVAERVHINIALFGGPIAEGAIKVISINTVKVKNATYDWNFGPAIVG